MKRKRSRSSVKARLDGRTKPKPKGAGPPDAAGPVPPVTTSPQPILKVFDEIRTQLENDIKSLSVQAARLELVYDFVRLSTGPEPLQSKRVPYVT
jgi:hypothetical protein